MSWWRRDRAKADGDSPPTDAETAELMRRLADEFVQRSGGPDLLDYTVESVVALDLLVDGLLESASPADVDKGFALSMGAYIGEVIVRHGRAARWVYDLDQRHAAVASARFSAFPVFKVSKRITIGPEHSLPQFVHAAINDAMPPEATSLSDRRGCSP